MAEDAPAGAAGFSVRLFDARHQLEGRLRRKVANPEFGQLVAEAMGRDKPFSAASVSQWHSGDQGASPAIIEAIASVCGVRAGWLAFGEPPMVAEKLRSAFERAVAAGATPDLGQSSEAFLAERRAAAAKKKRRQQGS